MTALKRGAPELFVNARVDTYRSGVGHGSTRDRAQRYIAASADGIFVPGLTDLDETAALVTEVGVPLNVLAQRPLAELAAVGVRRVSTGSLLFRAGLEAAVGAARRVRDGERVEVALTYAEAASYGAHGLT